VMNTYEQGEKANKALLAGLSGQVADLNKQIKSNQAQIQQMVQDAVMNTFGEANKANQNMVSSLTAQVEDISKKLMDLTKQYQSLVKKAEVPPAAAKKETAAKKTDIN